MPDYFLSAAVGDGSDTRGNQRRPDLFDYAKAAGQAAGVICDGGSHFLVKSVDLKASGPFEPIDRSHLAFLGVPDDGETDARAISLKIGRFILLEQQVGDLSDKDALASTIIQVKGIDTKDLSAQSKVVDYLALILPQIELPLDPKPASKGGTFTDNFEGEGSNTDPTAHTPSGGGSWVRTTGSALDGIVAPDGNLWSGTGDGTGGCYRCTDQGSADHYTQYTLASTSIGSMVCNRCTDASNYIGSQQNGGFYEVYKRNAGSFTELQFLAGGSANDVLRLESSGNNHTLYVNTVAIGAPVSDAFSNTVTRQGVNCRDNASTAAWLKDFEAGTLGGGAPTYPPPFFRFEPSTHLRM